MSSRRRDRPRSGASAHWHGLCCGWRRDETSGKGAAAVRHHRRRLGPGRRPQRRRDGPRGGRSADLPGPGAPAAVFRAVADPADPGRRCGGGAVQEPARPWISRAARERGGHEPPGLRAAGTGTIEQRHPGVPAERRGPPPVLQRVRQPGRGPPRRRQPGPGDRGLPAGGGDQPPEEDRPPRPGITHRREEAVPAAGPASRPRGLDLDPVRRRRPVPAQGFPPACPGRHGVLRVDARHVHQRGLHGGPGTPRGDDQPGDGHPDRLSGLDGLGDRQAAERRHQPVRLGRPAGRAGRGRRPGEVRLRGRRQPDGKAIRRLRRAVLLLRRRGPAGGRARSAHDRPRWRLRRRSHRPAPVAHVRGAVHRRHLPVPGTAAAVPLCRPPFRRAGRAQRADRGAAAVLAGPRAVHEHPAGDPGTTVTCPN